MPQFDVEPIPLQESDETTATNTKTFTIPEDYYWELYCIKVDYTSNATAGNRQLLIEFKNTDGLVIAEQLASITQAASLTYRYTFSVSGNHDLAVSNNRISQRLPYVGRLESSQSIVIYDLTDVDDASGENVLVRLSGVKWKYK